MKHLLPPTLLALPLLLAQCHRADPSPVSQLPAETQTGANTFGCLVNGQPWQPGGNDGFSNYSVVYDPSYSQGTLSVGAYRLTGSGADKQIVGFSSDSLKSTGNYVLKTGGRNQADFTSRSTNCSYHSIDKGTYCKGVLTITRLDRSAGIVSGTFAFTLYKPGCDTVKVTQGRFDKRL